MKNILIIGLAGSLLSGCNLGNTPVKTQKNEVIITPSADKIDSEQKAMALIGSDKHGRLANIMSHRLKARGDQSLNKSDFKVLNILKDEIEQDFTEDLYFKNMRMFGYTDEIMKFEDHYTIRNRWKMDASKQSYFHKTFPKGAKLAFHQESIPKNPNCETPVILYGELYPKNDKPLGLTISEESGAYRIKFNATPASVYSHRAILDVGCYKAKTEEQSTTDSSSNSSTQ